MCQLTDSQIEKIINILKESELTSYKISKETGITQATIGNYRRGKSIPTQANALILKRFFGIDFAEKPVNFSENQNSVVLGNNNTTGNIDNRQYYSDSPDVLRAQIDLLDERIKEKDAQIKEKDAQIKEKDAQIAKLLEILSKK
jgi:transcriptional regulator with XRE-family HTH domain